MNFNSLLERKDVVRRRLHRYGTTTAHRNICIPPILRVTAVSIFILWFIFVISYSASVVRPSAWSLRKEEVWTPYQLTSEEVLTGDFTDKAKYSGMYTYQHQVESNTSTTTNSAAPTVRSYRIFFPMDHQTSTSMHKYTVSDGGSYNKQDASKSTYLITQAGNKGHNSPNQDRSILIQDSKYHMFLAALFDGHGDLGHVTSHVAVTNLPLLLLHSIQTVERGNDETTTSITDDLMAKIIKDAFHSIDSRSVIAQVPRGGSTAVLVLCLRNTVYIASAGDSTAYVIQWLDTFDTEGTTDSTTTPKILPYSILKCAVQHKPSSPLERKRIEENGGTVYVPPRGSHDSSRVIYESLDETGRKIQTGLAMSRSLGDTAAKELGVVVSDPDIVTFTFPDSVNTVPSALPMKSNNYFVMLASDGLMDVMELSDLIILLGTALYDQRRSMSLETVCHTIVEHAVNNWNQATGNRYRDDISLAVHRIS